MATFTKTPPLTSTSYDTNTLKLKLRICSFSPYSLCNCDMTNAFQTLLDVWGYISLFHVENEQKEEEELTGGPGGPRGPGNPWKIPAPQVKLLYKII